MEFSLSIPDDPKVNVVDEYGVLFVYEGHSPNIYWSGELQQEYDWAALLFYRGPVITENKGA